MRQTADGGAREDPEGMGDAGADAGIGDAGSTHERGGIGEIGPLRPPDENGVRVAEGFTTRIVARSAQKPVAGAAYRWHGSPDGGATFPTEDGGWIYVSNAELPALAFPGATLGGAGALRFDAEGKLVDAYPILQGTLRNCAGGRTPWGTWLSCEEVPTGRVFECDPLGREQAIVRPALGVFNHEAAAIDPIHHHVYLTEDEPDGRLYRFVPDDLTPGGYPDLSRGRLEVASVRFDGSVSWRVVPDPSAAWVPTRRQVAGSTAFNGGEGIWYHEGLVYFSTKGDNRIWKYDIASATLSVLYDARTAANPILRGVDNVCVTPAGDVLVAEDGDDMQIVAILPDGSLKPIVQVSGHPGSEICGPALTPTGDRLYFSSQRGPNGNFETGGITYEVTGPFLK